jgi:hypothetical protein
MAEKASLWFVKLTTNGFSLYKGYNKNEDALKAEK